MWREKDFFRSFEQSRSVNAEIPALACGEETGTRRRGVLKGRQTLAVYRGQIPKGLGQRNDAKSAARDDFSLPAIYYYFSRNALTRHHGGE
jgi:hypothetical protein